MDATVSIVAIIADESFDEVSFVTIANHLACLLGLDTLPGNTFVAEAWDGAEHYLGCRGDMPAELAPMINAVVDGGDIPQELIAAYGREACEAALANFWHSIWDNPTDGRAHWETVINALGLTEQKQEGI